MIRRKPAALVAACGLLFFSWVPGLRAEPQTLERPDGSILTYEVSGEANADALFFIHCWGCSRSYWSDQIPVFSEDFRVVTLDLPGHGDSSAKGADWTFESMAEEAAAVAKELNLERFIIVGHSMGGPIALKLAAAMPGKVEGIVCVDTLHNLEFDFEENGFSLSEGNFEQNLRDFMPLLVHPSSDAGLVSWLINQALNSNRKVLLSLWEEFNRVDKGALMREAGVPVRCVNALPYNEMSPKTELAVNRKYGDFDVIFMQDTGHYPMLERPEEFNQSLKEAILQIRTDHKAKLGISPESSAEAVPGEPVSKGPEREKKVIAEEPLGF